MNNTEAQATNIYRALLAYETDGANPPDGRRTIRDERQTLHVRMARGDYGYATEAQRVLDMWRGVS